MTIAEKILSRASGKRRVVPGEIVNCKIDVAMAHDATGPLFFHSFGELADRVWDPDRTVVVVDHQYPPSNVGQAEFVRSTVDFAKKYGVKHFYYGEGICHQLLAERGHAFPGALIVGTDSHTTTEGALGAFGTGIGSTEMGAVMAVGELWFRVPKSLRFVLSGNLRDWVMAKDVVLRMIMSVSMDDANYRAVECTGPTVKDMCVDERMVLCNMAVELGAKTGIIEPDDRTLEYLKGRVSTDFRLMKSDSDAEYEDTREFGVSELEPQVACPHAVDNVKNVSEVEGTEIDQAFIGSCTGGRLNDLRIASKILEGRKVNRYTRMIVAPASKEIYSVALEEGLIQKMLKAGASVCAPSCGACLGFHSGVLAPGEVCISASNRNFKGRMGSPASKVYLASPATVAASAVEGSVTNPEEFMKG